MGIVVQKNHYLSTWVNVNVKGDKLKEALGSHNLMILRNFSHRDQGIIEWIYLQHVFLLIALM